MSRKEIADFYSRLTNGEKGRFIAFLSLKLGGSPHTWQQKFLGWTHKVEKRPVSPVIMKELVAIIADERWRG